MIDKVHHKDIVDAIEIHWRLQLGSYFMSVHNIDGAIYNLGGRVVDYYWNYAGLIRTIVGQESALIDKIVSFANNHDRVPAVYIDPTTQPPGFVKVLQKKMFQPEDEEIWMFYDSTSQSSFHRPKNLTITKVQSSEEMGIFIDVFNESYDLLGEGQTNSDYGLSLLDAFSSSEIDVKIIHFIGWVNETPVSIASTYIQGDVAGIYNVGTPEKFRCNGYGGALSRAAIEEANKHNCRRLLLQTELDSGPERLYAKLGFSPAFSAAIWSLTE